MSHPPVVHSTSDDGTQPRPHSKRLEQTQAQVDEVVGIMKINVEKVLERDSKLTILHDRANALEEGATKFERNACALKRKYWWKNLKMIIVIGVVVLIIVIVIVIWATYGKSSGSSNSAPAQHATTHSTSASAVTKSVINNTP